MFIQDELPKLTTDVLSLDMNMVRLITGLYAGESRLNHPCALFSKQIVQHANVIIKKQQSIAFAIAWALVSCRFYKKAQNRQRKIGCAKEMLSKLQRLIKTICLHDIATLTKDGIYNKFNKVTLNDTQRLPIQII